MKQFLAISGSLRAASINTAFCRVAARLAPASIHIEVFAGLGELPIFNPDLEVNPPPSVLALRRAVAQADALIVASPEYAHGISGAMKNALDWLVSFEGTVGKPVALVNTSPRAHHAYDALREILRTMSAEIVGPASISVPLQGGCTTEKAMQSSAEVSQSIKAVIGALAAHFEGDASAPSFAL